MISAVVLTKNEEKNIKGCLENLMWCNETIVIDDNSTDKSVEIAKKMGAQVYAHNLNFDFSKQRNYGLSKTKGDWVLFIDTDERVSNELKNEISHLISNRDRIKKLNGYFIKRVDFMWGRELKYGETGNIKLLRLARKNSGRWQGKVHEQWKVTGKHGQLKNSLYHYPHKNIAEFLKKINYYTDLRAKELYNKKVRVQWWDIILYPRIKFFTNYFFKRGFLDGVPGVIHALLMDLHSFLVRGKLWILWHR